MKFAFQVRDMELAEASFRTMRIFALRSNMLHACIVPAGYLQHGHDGSLDFGGGFDVREGQKKKQWQHDRCNKWLWHTIKPKASRLAL